MTKIAFLVWFLFCTGLFSCSIAPDKAKERLTLSSPTVFESAAPFNNKQEFLSYLKGLENQGKVLTGAYSENQVMKLNYHFGISVGLIGLAVNPNDWQYSASVAIYQWKKGRITLFLCNEEKHPNYKSMADFDPQNPNRNMEVYNFHIDQLKKTGDFFQKLKDNGVIVVWRPYHEMDGDWMWYHGNSSPSSFINSWRYMYQYLTQTRGLDNVVWSFSPTSYTGDMSLYPGNDYVDVIAPTLYHHTDRGLMTKGTMLNYDKYVNTGKPLGISELGPRSGFMGDAMYENPGDWNSINQSFKQVFPKISFFQAWEWIWALTPYFAGKDGNNGGKDILTDPRMVNLQNDNAKVADGVYAITAVHSGKSMTVSKGSPDNGAGIVQSTYNGGNHQKWSLTHVGNGFYSITALGSGKCIDVAGGADTNGTPVQQWDYWGGDNQKWFIYEIGQDQYVFLSKKNGLILDVSGISKEDNAALHLWEFMNNFNQKWTLTRLSAASSSSSAASSSSMPSINIPGTVEAENYFTMNGIQAEPCSEGGFDVGYIENGDWLEYPINVESSGYYLAEVRAATATSGGSAAFQVNGQNLGSVSITSTGDWQTWKSFNSTIYLNAGKQVIRLYCGGGNGYLFNINWVRFTKSATSSSVSQSSSKSSLYSSSSSAPSGGCAVNYTINNDWGAGATVTVTIKNNSGSEISGWNLQWTFPGSQKISNIWNATGTQNGANYSAVNLNYNSGIPANGGTVSFGFNLDYSGANAKPTSFTLNGKACGSY